MAKQTQVCIPDGRLLSGQSLPLSAAEFDESVSSELLESLSDESPEASAEGMVVAVAASDGGPGSKMYTSSRGCRPALFQDSGRRTCLKHCLPRVLTRPECWSQLCASENKSSRAGSGFQLQPKPRSLTSKRCPLAPWPAFRSPKRRGPYSSSSVARRSFLGTPVV